ncbi:hypothetical protein V6N11_072986 [Hibiscus sabdariffa]|uniref:Uncharacterized protein n=1 Tax=Hibiscus sabdariffa TaxID=183260 RepID=A0ABR2NX69_9ROSI
MVETSKALAVMTRSKESFNSADKKLNVPIVQAVEEEWRYHEKIFMARGGQDRAGFQILGTGSGIGGNQY